MLNELFRKASKLKIEINDKIDRFSKSNDYEVKK